MATEYLRFSELITHLTEQEETWLKEQLQPVSIFGDEVFCEGNIPERLAGEAADWTGARLLLDSSAFNPCGTDLWFDYEFQDDDKEGRVLWAYSLGHGFVEVLVYLVQKFLGKFRPDQYWTLAYSITCSKPRVGYFYGGAVFVTAKEIKFHSVDSFLEEQREAFEAERRNTSK